MRQPLLGWPLLGLALLSALLQPQPLKRHLAVLCAVLAILGLAPINTSLEPTHLLIIGAVMTAVVGLPYLLLERWYHDDAIRFQWHHGRRWSAHEIGYIAFTAAATYLILPIYFASTQQYRNWTFTNDAVGRGQLFAGLFIMGTWDEMFFAATVLGILRRHLPFWQANLAQAVIFSSFLYELGFRSWGYGVALAFGLIQGYVFKRTGSLLYAITIHLTFDLVMFFALIHAYYPQQMPIFLTPR